MGNLAAAGLLAGIGQGAVMEGEQMDKEKMQHLDLQRELTMAQLKAGYEQQQQSREFQFQSGEHAQQRASEQAMNTERVTHEDARNEGDTASKEKISADMIAAQNERARQYRAMRFGIAGNKAGQRPQSRWEFHDTPATSSIVNGQIVTTPAQSIVHDKMNRLGSLVQIGDRFVPVGTDPSSLRRSGPINPRTGQPMRSPAEQASVEALMSGDPKYTPEGFQAKWGYIPQEYVGAQDPTFQGGQPPISGDTSSNGGTGLPGYSATEPSDNAADYAAAVEPVGATPQ